MSESVFDSKQEIPDTGMLPAVLADAGKYFDRIVAFVRKEYGTADLQWKYYGEKSGWILKLLHGKQNILFIIPCRDHFRVSLTFGEKAVCKIMEGEFSDDIKDALFAARKYAEGRTIQLDVRSDEQCDRIVSLIRVKQAK